MLTMLPPLRLRFARDHALRDRLGDEERALEVGVDHLVPVGLGLLEHALRHRDAGIVDQHVDRAERVLDGRDRALDAGVVGDVQSDARDLAAAGGNLALQLGELVQLAGGEADRGAALGQHPGEALAEALRGAGDQRDAAGQIEQIAHRGLLKADADRRPWAEYRSAHHDRYEPPLTGRITPLV